MPETPRGASDADAGPAEEPEAITHVDRLWPRPGRVPLDELREHYARSWPDVEEGAVAMMVASLDGSSSLDGVSGGLSSPVDQKLMDVLRSVADVVVVGSATLQEEGYGGLRVSPESARWRLAHGMSEHPALAVVSGSLSFPADIAFLADAPVRPLILTGTAAPRERVEALREVADVVVAGGIGGHDSHGGGHNLGHDDGRVDPVRAHAELAARGHRRVLSEGGPGVLTQWHTAGLVAQLQLSVAPALAGGAAGRILHGEQAPARHTELLQVLHDGSMLMVQHKVLPR